MAETSSLLLKPLIQKETLIFFHEAFIPKHKGRKKKHREKIGIKRRW